MQIEELEKNWRQLDQKLDRSLALESELLRRAILQPARRRIHRVAFWPLVDVAFSLAVLAACGLFLSRHWRDGRALLPAAVVSIGAAALLVSSIRQLRRIAKVDWSGPVAEIQGSLERLRIAKILQLKWVLLLSPLVGFCGLIAGLHGLLGWLLDGRVDLFDKVNPWWIIANYAFGVLFVPFGYLAARALASRCHRHRWWQALLDDVAGKSLKVATRDVERWASL